MDKQAMIHELDVIRQAAHRMTVLGPDNAKMLALIDDKAVSLLNALLQSDDKAKEGNPDDED